MHLDGISHPSKRPRCGADGPLVWAREETAQLPWVSTRYTSKANLPKHPSNGVPPASPGKSGALPSDVVTEEQGPRR